MPITLKIISYQRLTPGQGDSFQTNLSKFSIGRGPNNQWSLPDPQRFMSTTHCWLEHRGGNWLVTDSSTNGLFLNGSTQRMTPNESVAIKHGDRIKLGDYELEISLLDSPLDASDDEFTPGFVAGPFEDDLSEIIPAQRNPPAQHSTATSQTPRTSGGPELKEANTPLSQMDKGLLGDSVSIDDLYQLDAPREEKKPPPTLASQGDQVSPLDRHFAAPRVSAEPQNAIPGKYATDLDDIPDNWDEETGLVPAHRPQVPEPPQAPPEPPQIQPPAQNPTEPRTQTEPRRTQPEAPPAMRAPTHSPEISANSAMMAFTSGAGLDPNQFSNAEEMVFFHELGALLKAMTEGLMKAIASRSQIKSEFRLEQTIIAPTENNPFKFSVSAEEAMARLLSNTKGAYLSGPQAASEAIDDLNAHQMAVMAGTEAALKSILRRFKPASLEARLGSGSAIEKALPLVKKAKYWEFYKALYDEISEAADDDFQNLFGSEFAKAYENQLERLRMSRED